MKPVVFTVGHSNHPIEVFDENLKAFAIRCLIDIRSIPASRYNPQFNRNFLEKHLNDQGIAYVFMGDALGGRPSDPSLRGPDGKPDYRRMSLTPVFRQGIMDVLQIAATMPAVIMCSERNPLHCHRFHLTAPALVREGARVEHILHQAKSVPHEELIRTGGHQWELF